MEEMKVKEWIGSNKVNGYSSGYGSGYGAGYGDCYGSGDGSGDGSGFGDGSGYGYGDGYGDGYGSGYGDGYGDGDGSGSGSGYGSGYGSGSGSGDDIKQFNGVPLFSLDGVCTGITSIKSNIAKGFILNVDLTTEFCYIVKGNGHFAHGKTIREAQQALASKYMEDMDEGEVIDKFLSEFEHGRKYKGTVFFDWHHYLTGSCLMGRESFVKNHGLDLDEDYTVDEFIEICENDYGSDIIKHLKEEWDSKHEK